MSFINSTFWGLFFGTIGTFIGGLIGVSFKNLSNRLLSFLLALASGLMLSVISFDLIPEATSYSKIPLLLLGIFLGILMMIFCELIVNKLLYKKIHASNTLLKTGIVVCIGLALHNIPEGLAIGSGLEHSLKLGFSLAIIIAIHDVPEGISMSAPMKKSGIAINKILFYVLLSGLATGIGAFFGSLVGNISEKTISISLSIAAGAMLYVVSGELTPEYNKLHSGKMSAISNIVGFILGYLVTHI